MSLSQVPPELLPYLVGTKKDYSSLQDSVVRISITFAVIVTITTSLRLWVRVRMLRAVGADDILMIVAYIFAILLSTSCLIGTTYGLGKHIWNLSPDLFKIPQHTARVTKALYGCYLSYSMAIAFVKFSIIATYQRIFSDGLLRKTVLGIGLIVLGLLICNIFAIIFTCVPVQAAWRYEIKGKCFPIIHFFYASSSINIATDLALCFLPIPTLWALSMPKSQRVVLCILFALGAFTCVASILRLRSLFLIGAISSDFSYNVVHSLNWCVIEVGTAITCASLSTLRPLLARILPKLFSRLTTNHSASNRQPSRLTPQARAGAAKLSSLNRSQSRSHSMAWGSGEHEAGDRGDIMVQQSFQMKEEWEMQSPQAKTAEKGEPERPGRVYGKTREVFDGSSEEELVLDRRQPGPKRTR